MGKTIHGQCKKGHKEGTPTYRAWRNAKDRCYNHNNASYPHYGERGITMCSRWIDSFPTFLADMGERPDGLTLERLDVNKGYSSDNCTWVDIRTQNRNRTNCRWLSFGGQTQIMSDWARQFHISLATLFYLLKTRGDLQTIVKEFNFAHE